MRPLGRSEEEGAEGIDRVGDVHLAVIVGVAGRRAARLLVSGEEEEVEDEDGIGQVEGGVRIAVSAGEGLAEITGLQGAGACRTANSPAQTDYADLVSSRFCTIHPVLTGADLE